MVEKGPAATQVPLTFIRPSTSVLIQLGDASIAPPGNNDGQDTEQATNIPGVDISPGGSPGRNDGHSAPSALSGGDQVMFKGTGR